MDTFKLVEGYMSRLFRNIEGMKILLVDHETSGIISMVMSQSALFEHDVFLVDYLDNQGRQSQKNLTCICLIRPSSQNIDKLADELKDPKYSQYYLYFNNYVKHTFLERIAEADEYELVKEFEEVFCDYYPLYRSVFTFNKENMNLKTGYNTNPTVSRVLDGLASLFFAYKRRPVMRYSGKSNDCLMFAKELNSVFDTNSDYFSTSSNSMLLLIMDRLDDPITPLLTQWTYQAMIHEFFVIKNGRVRLETPNVNTELVLNYSQDSFYSDQMFLPIWQVAESVQKLVGRYQKLTRQSSEFSSIADMKRFMEDYPEYKRLSQHVNKHVSLASELLKMSEQTNLRAISQFEQDLVTSSESPESAWTRLKTLLQDPLMPHYHKLRLCMMALCHVGIFQPLDHLSRLGFSDDDISFLKYFYLTKTSMDQASGTLAASVKSWIGTSSFPELGQFNTSGLIKHIPKIFEVVDQALRDKLPDAVFPHVSDGLERASGKPKEIVIFLVNGATFEEARYINLLNTIYPSANILLGSNFIHNNRSFIAEMFKEWTASRTPEDPNELNQ